MLNTNDLLDKYKKTCLVKTFSDVLEQSGGINRELLIGDVDEEYATGAEMAIRFWNLMDKDIPIEERMPIKVYINSYGGSVTAGLTIIDAITMSKTPVYTIVMGAAYSMGLEIAIAGHKRYCYKNASYLFHEGSISTGSIDANKFKNLADFYKKELERTKQNLFRYTAVTEEWYKEHQNDDVWLFSEEALELKLVDEVIEEFIL